VERKRCRREGARARTEQPGKAGKSYRRILSELYPDPEFEYERPRTRGDCLMMRRPCPFVSCRHHLYLDVVKGRRGIKINFPDKEPWELEYSCSLDLVDGDGRTLDEVGAFMNLTRERVRQIEEDVLGRLKEDVLVAAVVFGRKPETTEAEMKILEMARRIVEINRQIGKLEQERETLLSKLEALSMKANPEPMPPPPPEPYSVRLRATKTWVLDQLKEGWVSTRLLGGRLPDRFLDGEDPRKMVKKAIEQLAGEGLIVNGASEGKSKSWRLAAD